MNQTSVSAPARTSGQASKRQRAVDQIERFGLIIAWAITIFIFGALALGIIGRQGPGSVVGGRTPLTQPSGPTPSPLAQPLPGPATTPPPASATPTPAPAK